MKGFSTSVLIITVTGCTTLRPVNLTADEIPQQISSGELLKRGDHVVIQTRDWRTHEFDITSLSGVAIGGEHESIPVDQIHSIEKRELNANKTLLLVGLILGGIAFTVVLAHAFQSAAAAGILNSTH